jgi:hypothetical protein
MKNSKFLALLLPITLPSRSGLTVRIAIFFVCLMAAVLSAQAQGGPKPEFVWDASQPFKINDRVKFVNGDFIQVAEGKVSGRVVKEECEYQRLEVRSGSDESLRYITNACDSLVHIQAAYPDSKNAKLAIVTTNCGGTICGNWSDHFVVFIGDSGVRVTRIGTSYIGPKNKITKYEFAFNGPRLNWSNITNFYDGSENSLGDLIPSFRMFIRQGQYIDRKFEKKYLKFVGEHPDEVLGNAEVRANIVEKMKPERFQAFRIAMSGPGSSFILNGRFLVMDACMKSNCPYQFGSVVLDGFTGALHAIRYNPDENLVDHVSSRPLEEDLDQTWLSEVDTQQKYRLSIVNGRIRAIKNRNK